MSGINTKRPRPSGPLVSIVTPCLNMAPFVRETIDSVLSQDYRPIEYILMDGGSTDGTLDILRGYEDRLRWESAPDHGAADAINRGFALSSGEILAYLNADDVYLPGAVSTVVRAFEDHPEAAGIYGGAWWVNSAGDRIAPYPVLDFDPGRLAEECFIAQPATFLRRDALERVGGIDPNLKFTFDYELWMRIARLEEMVRIEETLAHSRMWPGNKSLGHKRGVFEETFQVFQRHYGYVPFSWIYSYVCFRADGRDQFFEPLVPSTLRYAASLPVGLYYNRRAARRYFDDWRSAMSWQGLRRRLGHFPNDNSR